MAFKFFNPATLLPTPREAVRPPPPDNTMGVILGSVMENIGRVAREKREFDALVAEGNATADYLDTISPNLGTMVRNRVQGYAPDPFLGYGGVDAKTERASLLKGAFEFSKLENERQANAARAAAANASGLAQFNNYQYKLQAAQSAYGNALQNASQANAQYNTAIADWRRRNQEAIDLNGRGLDPSTMPVKDTTWDKAAADAKVTLDRFLNMSQEGISAEATPRRAGVVPSIGQSNNVTSSPLANPDGTAVAPVTQVVADSDLPAVPGDGATLFGSPLDAAPPPVNTPSDVAAASVLPPSQLTDEKIYNPGDVVPPANAAPAEPSSPRPPLLASQDPAPVLNPPVITGSAGTSVPGSPSTVPTPTMAPPGAASDPNEVAKAQQAVKVHKSMRAAQDTIDGIVTGIDLRLDQITNPGKGKQVRAYVEKAKQRLLDIQEDGGPLPGSTNWQKQADAIIKDAEDKLSLLNDTTAAERKERGDQFSQVVKQYRDRNDEPIEIIRRPVNWNSETNEPTEFQYFYRDPVTGKFDKQISNDDIEGPNPLYFPVEGTPAKKGVKSINDIFKGV